MTKVVWIGDRGTVHPQHGKLEHGDVIEVAEDVAAAMVLDSAHWKKVEPPSQPATRPSRKEREDREAAPEKEG